MCIVRTFYPWNWGETLPGQYDLDRMFDLAGRNGLKLWVDTPLGTHMACPAWMLRQHPDMAAVRRDGTIQTARAFQAAAHGAMTHNFDHPMWRVYAERYLRHIVPRYKDHPAMGVWGTWDGITLPPRGQRTSPIHLTTTIRSRSTRTGCIRDYVRHLSHI